ncbi:MAG: septum formation protein Maf [Planctomycetes bacterium]|nr:septum formation protein Maf [Planctomycetota bacterium]
MADAKPVAIVLASTSPRRRSLLAAAGVQFESLDPGPDGHSSASEPRLRVMEYAATKAACGHQLRPDAVILASDTLVWCGGEFLPKPVDRADARRMLEMLQHGRHEVWTAVCVRNPAGEKFADAAVAQVEFGRIPPTELEHYLNGQEWVDKAGAYGIQGTAEKWAHLRNGDLDTVIGLPVSLSLRLLRQAGACPSAI